jgi:hypothetical protein
MKLTILALLLTFIQANIFSQRDEEKNSEYFGTFGLVVVGINKANEILSPDNPTLSNDQIKSRTTIQAGINFQVKPFEGFGLGGDLGFMLNQKGYSRIAIPTDDDPDKTGYRLINHLEIPLYLRYAFAKEGLGASVLAGVYGGYAISGKSSQSYDSPVEYIEFEDNKARFDYGYSLGFGLDAQVIGLDFVWSRGLKDNAYGYSAPHTSRNSMFSLVLRLMIPSY